MGLFSGRPKLGPSQAEQDAAAAEAEQARLAAEAAANAPKPITRDEVVSLLNEGFKAIAERIGESNARPVVLHQPPVAATPEPEISDDDIERAIITGAGSASAVKGLVRQLLHRELAGVRNEVAALRDTGLGAIETMVERHSEASLPFYKRFKKEIDTQLAQLTPELRINPMAVKQIHDAVVGANWQTVADEVIEAKTRQAAEAAAGGVRGSATPGGGVGGASDRNDEGFSIDDFGGKDAIRALNFKDGGAQSPDDFARKLGYKNFAEYSRLMADVDKQYK